MPRIRILIGDAGLTATVEVTAGPLGARADLDRELDAAQVRHGRDEATLANLARCLADPQYVGKVVVARGTPARAGNDGHVAGLPPRSLGPGEVRANGSIDWRERHCLHPVGNGQEIGQLVAATPGEPGRNVLGQVLAPKPGRPSPRRLGPGITTEGDRLLANRGGVLLDDGRLLDVVPLFTHAGDVDGRSGNLHSKGSLEVRGDVAPNARAIADGDVHVTGSVLGGTVTAGGNVHVDQGVLGRDASITAGSDLTLRHATSATLQSGGRIVVGDQATHCRIFAQALSARTGRGAVFGGETRVRGSIAVRCAGTDIGAATRFVVADLVDREAAVVRATNLDQKVVARSARCLDGNRPTTKSLRSGLRAADTALDERLRLQQARRELLAEATVEIDDIVHPGVDLVFGERVLAVTAARRHVRFRWCAATDSICEEPLP